MPGGSGHNVELSVPPRVGCCPAAGSAIRDAIVRLAKTLNVFNVVISLSSLPPVHCRTGTFSKHHPTANGFRQRDTRSAADPGTQLARGALLPARVRRD